MLKILARIFPIVDHLYIFQLFEYNSLSFLKWFIKYPLKRNLQKKHKITLTPKALLILAVASIFLVADAINLSQNLFGSFYLFLIFAIFLQTVSPIYLIIARIFLIPLEAYQKNKVFKKTQEKLNSLSKLKIVAITGSFGKTSTKDILYTLLWKKYRVVKTPKSFNTPLGVAQTILEDVKQNTDVLIAEVGAYKKGEIKKIASLIRPNIGVITAVGPQHLGRFGSLENITKAKFEIIEGLPKNGIAVINTKDSLLIKLAEKLECKIILFGDESEYFISNIKTASRRTSFSLNTPKGKISVEIPLIGAHHTQNFLIASIVAIKLGLGLKEIQQRAKLLLPTPHRLEIKKEGDLTIIDNSYNTNPKASLESFKLLKEIQGSQKILITPGLVELGKEAEKENIEFAKNAGDAADEIIIVGENAKEYLLKGLRDVNYPKEKIHLVKELNYGLSLLSKIAKPSSVVLLENDLPDQYF